VTLVFFFWPGGQALYMSVLQQDPFGQSVRFVGLENFRLIFEDPEYLRRSVAHRVLLARGHAAGHGAGAAARGDGRPRHQGLDGLHHAMLVPYAVAPAVAGVLWLFMFNPSIGVWPGG
jgi:sn-glycerol 3-phosphate transport system permease protein